MYSAEPRPSHGGELAWLSCLRRNIIIMKLSSTTTLIIPIIIFKVSTQRKVKNLSKFRKNLEFTMSYNIYACMIISICHILPYLLNRS